MSFIFTIFSQVVMISIIEEYPVFIFSSQHYTLQYLPKFGMRKVKNRA